MDIYNILLIFCLVVLIVFSLPNFIDWFQSVVIDEKYDVFILKSAFETYHQMLLVDEKYEEIVDVLRIIVQLENGHIHKSVKKYIIKEHAIQIHDYNMFKGVMIIDTVNYEIVGKK